MREVNCRGLSCPIPVLKTKEALESMDSGEIVVIVDNKASKENVKRFAQKMGCQVKVEEKEGEFHIYILKGEGSKEKKEREVKEEGGKEITILIASSYVGEDKELGKILIKGFIKTFLNAQPIPKRIILINTAVKLACRGADPEILEALKELSNKGVEIICCGTCLDYFKLLEDLEVGVASNAYDVVQALVNSDSVIRL
ncbi:tRNA 2-thiouridine synthesizing protein A [Thermovibrio guaymasensis]|uniref:tRNA 2-thiouridine synthesizing protein A n=1 Tax=Thermovibrio guaymasensis TaxID=240167 RepID=A0A420W6K5_9BACT|nr:sulfurtransferase-like selenium metabolism protein YedF [Thermovibrio guaymasensis]RKQ61706.1 tRNA 2-thiouridine synthesizing protein A [Thermovibrio guaymasensis]